MMNGMRLGSLGATAALCLSVSAAALAQTSAPKGDAEASAALNGGAHPSSGAQPASVEQCWADWKAKEKLEDGKNEKKNGYFVYVAHSQDSVKEPVGSRSWLAARNAAFTYAELSARKSLAEAMRTTIRSNRSVTVKLLGGDDAPPSLRPVVEQLSIVDKSLALLWQNEGTREVFADSHATAMSVGARDVRCWRMA